MKTLFPVLAAALALAACAADAPPARADNTAHIRRQCEQHFAKVSDMMERGKKVKACVRARTAP